MFQYKNTKRIEQDDFILFTLYNLFKGNISFPTTVLIFTDPISFSLLFRDIKGNLTISERYQGKT